MSHPGNVVVFSSAIDIDTKMPPVPRYVYMSSCHAGTPSLQCASEEVRTRPVIVVSYLRPNLHQPAVSSVDRGRGFLLDAFICARYGRPIRSITRLLCVFFVCSVHAGQQVSGKRQ